MYTGKTITHKTKHTFVDEDVAQLVKCMPNIPKAVGPISSTIQIKCGALASCNPSTQRRKENPKSKVVFFVI